LPSHSLPFLNFAEFISTFLPPALTENTTAPKNGGSGIWQQDEEIKKDTNQGGVP
jgi:hypothetical protein